MFDRHVFVLENTQNVSKESLSVKQKKRQNNPWNAKTRVIEKFLNTKFYAPIFFCCVFVFFLIFFIFCIVWVILLLSYVIIFSIFCFLFFVLVFGSLEVRKNKYVWYVLLFFMSNLWICDSIPFIALGPEVTFLFFVFFHFLFKNCD